MSDSIISGADFVALSVISGEPVGTAMEIQLKGTHPLILQEVVAKPDAEDISGKVLTSINKSYAVATITAGSGEIWLRCYRSESSCRINISLL